MPVWSQATCLRSGASPLNRIFLHVLVLPSSSSLCKISFGGSATCGLFYKHALAFVPFSFYHPLHVGEQLVEYPQWMISIQRTKAIAAIVRQLTPSCLQPNSLT